MMIVQMNIHMKYWNINKKCKIKRLQQKILKKCFREEIIQDLVKQGRFLRVHIQCKFRLQQNEMFRLILKKIKNLQKQGILSISNYDLMLLVHLTKQ
ncbi:unnamed protein product [Paramecium sonneborni]|uniref:Uncharacterized protein n=1 Tax=Paramecium sonneborni TaxID=65129 RepID=A0A8S1QMJ3_9CILI|nr:unnamed protein product [Paramecium sonneborni]